MFLKLTESVLGFARNKSADMQLKMALLLGAIALAFSVLAAPMLETASVNYAENKSYGIDRVLTGSINGAKRYRVRKSVLDQNIQDDCWQNSSTVCVTRD